MSANQAETTINATLSSVGDCFQMHQFSAPVEHEIRFLKLISMTRSPASKTERDYFNQWTISNAKQGAKDASFTSVMTTNKARMTLHAYWWQLRQQARLYTEQILFFSKQAKRTNAPPTHTVVGDVIIWEKSIYFLLLPCYQNRRKEKNHIYKRSKWRDYVKNRAKDQKIVRPRMYASTLFINSLLSIGFSTEQNGFLTTYST